MAPRGALLFSLRLLVHERARLFASVGGVTFALLLMLLQVGFRNALLDSALELLRAVDAEIIVIDKEKDPFLRRKDMPRERLYQALSATGVESAAPVWINLVQWRNLEDGTLHPIRLIGFEPDLPTFLIPSVNAQLEPLKQRGRAIVDSRSRSAYGDIDVGRAEVGRREVEIVGQFPLGADFEVDGNLIVSAETFLDLTGDRQQHIEMALLKLSDDANPEAVLAQLAAILPSDVRAFTKAQLIERDLAYWEAGTPISVILLVGVALGFAVGVVICYQILYTEVLDHIAEFATVKAMGYSNGYIQWVVVVEAWVLSLFGFLPSVVLGWLMLSLLEWISGLPAGLGGQDILLVLGLSVTMCSIAAFLALRKVRLLDPAELF
jgi:putative ABC transport system permease protein